MYNLMLQVVSIIGRFSSRKPWFLKPDAPIPVGGSLVVVGGDQKVVLEPGDAIKVTSDTASSADVVLSHLDIT